MDHRPAFFSGPVNLQNEGGRERFVRAGRILRLMAAFTLSGFWLLRHDPKERVEDLIGKGKAGLNLPGNVNPYQSGGP